MTRYPWPCYRDPWECLVTDVRLDDGAAALRVNGDLFRVDAFADAWSSAELAVEVTTDEPPIRGIQDLRAHVLLTCAATHLRRSYLLEIDGEEAHPRFKGRLTIPRSVVAGKATLTAELIGTYEGRQRSVGSSVPWALVVDVSDAPQMAGIPPLQTVWVDFGGAEAPLEARRWASAPAYLDLSATTPVLYLNKGIDGLQLLILSNNAKLERRRHRDMLGAVIARYAANALFRAAAEQVTADGYGGRPEVPGSRVLRDMCEAVAAQLPDAETVDDLYDMLADLSEGRLNGARFWANVDLAIDKLTSAPTIAQICEEAKRV
jgi:hypothetical protein